ncbi:hypothetical protein RHSIM_Rhsim02G0005100 [Rhododendron simsii]|uniref:Uncharacterized protein n=1 Tax=Rhododendron simsii TaxID=118357 RepID=A0A834HCZ2_RHOSS|nr:hypothetical protein RHSIM_Rhsim02G0005100 [Rhododendron simsii]
MAIGSFFKALHTALGAAAQARFSTTYALVIFILTASVGAETYIRGTFSSKPAFELLVTEKMEALDATLMKIPTTATTISTITTGMSKTLADLLPTLLDLLKSKGKRDKRKFSSLQPFGRPSISAYLPRPFIELVAIEPIRAAPFNLALAYCTYYLQLVDAKRGKFLASSFH